MASSYDPLIAELRAAVLSAPGALSPEIRQAASDRRTDDPALSSFVETVDGAAHRLTDEDVRALGKTLSEDQIFELAVSAAFGASMRRLHAGLEALKASQQEVAR